METITMLLLNDSQLKAVKVSMSKRRRTIQAANKAIVVQRNNSLHMENMADVKRLENKMAVNDVEMEPIIQVLQSIEGGNP